MAGFPVLVRNKKDLSFADLWNRAAYESINHGHHLYAPSVDATSATQTIGQIQPDTPTEAFLCNSITLSVKGGSCVITLLNATGPDFPALRSSQTRYVLSETGNSGITIPVRKIMQGQISVQVSSASAANMSIAVTLDAYRITADPNYNAEKVILYIGDSITRGTNLGGTILTASGDNAYTAVSAEDHFTFQLKDYFQKKGIDCRLVNKAMGNYDSNGIEGWRKRGWLDIDRADIVFWQLGVNDAQNAAITDAVYRQNILKIIDLRDRRYPGSKLILVGDTSIDNETREARTAQLRVIKQNIANEFASRGVYYVSLAGLWDRKVLTNYNSNDGVHPNIANNVLMANALKSWCDANNITF